MPGKHKTLTSKDFAEKLLHSIFDDFSEVEVLTGGEFSQAFSFKSDKQQLVLRINKSKTFLELYEKEKFAFEFYKEVLPIPEIFKVGEFESFFYSITEKVEGIALEDLSIEDQKKLVPEILDVIEVFSKSEVQKDEFGWFLPNGMGKYKSWREEFEQLEFGDGYKSWDEIFKTTFFEKEVFEEFWPRIKKNLNKLPEIKNFAHGDFSVGNVLVKNNKIAGIIDWGNSMYGDFLFSLAIMEFWSPELEILDEYLRKKPNKENFEERIECYKSKLALGALAYYARSEQKDSYENLKKRILKN